MPINTPNLSLITVADHIQTITAPTKQEQKLNILLTDIGSAIEKLQPDPRQAYQYLDEELSSYGEQNRYNRIENGLKEIRTPFPAAMAKLSESYVNILASMYQSKVISGMEVQSHLIKLLPEVFTGWNEPMSELFAKLLVDSLESSPIAIKDMIKKLSEEMPDATNAVIDLQRKMTAYQRISERSANSSMHANNANNILVTNGLMKDNFAKKSSTKRVSIQDKYSAPEKMADEFMKYKEKIHKYADRMSERRRGIDQAAGLIYQQSLINRQVDKQRPGALSSAIAGCVNTIMHEGLYEHGLKNLESTARDAALADEKAADYAAKIAYRESQETFNIMELAGDVAGLVDIVTSITSFVKECNIETLIAEGQLKQSMDHEMKSEKQERMQEKEREKTRGIQIINIKNDIKKLEKVVSEIDSALKKGLKLHGLSRLIGLREIVVGAIKNSNTLVIAMEDPQKLREEKKVSDEPIEELPENIQNEFEKQEEINAAISSLTLESATDDDSDTEIVRLEPTAEDLQKAHVRPMIVDDEQGGKKTIYVGLTNDESVPTYKFNEETGQFLRDGNHVDRTSGRAMRLPGGFNLLPYQKQQLREYMKKDNASFAKLDNDQLDKYIDSIPSASADSFSNMRAFLTRAKNGKEASWVKEYQPVKETVGHDTISQVQPKIRRDKIEVDSEAGPSTKKKKIALTEGGSHSVLPRSKTSTSGALNAPFSGRPRASASSTRGEPVASAPEQVIMAKNKSGEEFIKYKLQKHEWPEKVIHFTTHDSSVMINSDNYINASNKVRGHNTDKVGGFFATTLTPENSTEEEIIRQVIGTNSFGGRSNRAKKLYQIDTSRLPEGTNIWRVSYSKDVFIVETPSLDKSLRIDPIKTATNAKSAVIWKGEFDKYGKE